MGWADRVGAAEVGKYADIVTVDGDPLANLKVLRQVTFVMKGGAIATNTGALSFNASGQRHRCGSDRWGDLLIRNRRRSRGRR
jgi:cytosine/adenosine deaminase-related metal-dependent hydrolase